MSKISELSDGGVVQGGDTLIAVRSGGNVKVTYGGSTTADINGGTIDNAVIGGTTAAAGTFTTGQFDTSVNVDGTVTADGLTVDGNTTVNHNIFEVSSTTPSIRLTETDVTGENTQLLNAGGKLRIRTASDDYGTATERLRIDHSTGDISFYEDTGTTAKMVWKASDERLGIGNAAPATALDVTGTVTADGLTVDGDMAIDTDTLFVDVSEDRVGINTSSPAGTFIAVGNAMGLGNNLATSNGIGGAFSFVDPDGRTIQTTVRLGDDSNASAGLTGVTDLQIINYGSSDDAGGGNIRFINSRYSTETGLIKSSREVANTGYMDFYTENSGLKKRMRLAASGDISFYEDTGTTAKLFWDASEERLGIGTTSPAAKLEIGGAGEGIILASPDGTRYEITVSDLGVLTVTAV